MLFNVSSQLMAAEHGKAQQKYSSATQTVENEFTAFARRLGRGRRRARLGVPFLNIHTWLR
jgi:hypothetical protein